MNNRGTYLSGRTSLMVVAAHMRPPRLKNCHNCHAPRLLLDNRIHAVTGTSFCVPSGRWGGAVTGGLRR